MRPLPSYTNGARLKCSSDIFRLFIGFFATLTAIVWLLPGGHFKNPGGGYIFVGFFICFLIVIYIYGSRAARIVMQKLNEGLDETQVEPKAQ